MQKSKQLQALHWFFKEYISMTVILSVQTSGFLGQKNNFYLQFSVLVE